MITRQKLWFVVVTLALVEPNLLSAQETRQTEEYLERMALESLDRRLTDRLMEDPTKLSEFAATAGVSTEVIGVEVSIVSRESTADIAAVKVSSTSGAQEVGMRINFMREGDSDSVYLDFDQARRIRDEFWQFRIQEIPRSDCGANNTCYNQPVRCFPIQTMVQAICGSVYYTSNQILGVVFRTARGEFRFPSVPAIDFYEAFDAVVPIVRCARRE